MIRQLIQRQQLLTYRKSHSSQDYLRLLLQNALENCDRTSIQEMHVSCSFDNQINSNTLVAILIMFFQITIYFFNLFVHNLERNETSLVSSRNSGTSVPNRLVCDSEFSKVHSNHLRPHLNSTKHLSIVNSDD